jgi:hypothetical protein
MTTAPHGRKCCLSPFNVFSSIQIDFHFSSRKLLHRCIYSHLLAAGKKHKTSDPEEKNGNNSIKISSKCILNKLRVCRQFEQKDTPRNWFI